LKSKTYHLDNDQKHLRTLREVHITVYMLTYTIHEERIHDFWAMLGSFNYLNAQRLVVPTHRLVLKLFQSHFFILPMAAHAYSKINLSHLDS